MSEWISTKDRMPDQFGEYLVTWEFDRMVIIAWYARMTGTKKVCFHYVGNDGYDVSIEDEVLAWMPLPEPYEEDRHGKEKS